MNLRFDTDQHISVTLPIIHTQDILSLHMQSKYKWNYNKHISKFYFIFITLLHDISCS